MTGVIKRLMKDKGFGFIRNDGGVEYFFHRSSMERSAEFDALSEGDRVTFEEDNSSSKGPRAANVFPM